MLCDVHIHFIPEQLSIHTSFYKGIWTDKLKLYDFLDNHSIEKALLVYPSTDAGIKLGSSKKECQIYNSALEEIMKENKKIIASCILDLDDLGSVASQIKDLKNKGFSAISLPSSYKGSFIVDKLDPVFAAANECSMPIFIHPQTINPIGFERIKDPLLMPVLEYSFDISMCLGLLMMNQVLDKYKIKFIFSSLGGIVPFLKNRFDRVYLMLRKRELVKDLGKVPSEILQNVYVDTSGSSLGNIELALDLFGEDNILWGSDYPVNAGIEQNLGMLDKLGSKVKEKIISKNLLKVFG
tara:strand:+ start:230 stop:1117 length:888 start_codon:yes stop_codon:yes gene_type:complete